MRKFLALTAGVAIIAAGPALAQRGAPRAAAPPSIPSLGIPVPTAPPDIPSLGIPVPTAPPDIPSLGIPVPTAPPNIPSLGIPVPSAPSGIPQLGGATASAPSDIPSLGIPAPTSGVPADVSATVPANINRRQQAACGPVGLVGGALANNAYFAGMALIGRTGDNLGSIVDVERNCAGVETGVTVQTMDGYRHSLPIGGLSIVGQSAVTTYNAAQLAGLPQVR